MIEDAVSGVAAAKAAGSRCLGLTTSFSAEQLAAAGADWTAPDLELGPGSGARLVSGSRLPRQESGVASPELRNSRVP